MPDFYIGDKVHVNSHNVCFTGVITKLSELSASVARDGDGKEFIAGLQTLTLIGKTDRMKENVGQQKFEDNVDEMLGELRAVLISRHRKYGPANINKHGVLGIKIRLDDKQARLEYSEENHDDESVDDTLIDKANYYIIWLMLRRGLWPT